MALKRTTIFLLEQDQRLIRLLQARYGLATQSDVIRFALRTVGEAALASGKPAARLSSKRTQYKEKMAAQREHLLAQARTVSAHASALHQHVATYLQSHKG